MFGKLKDKLKGALNIFSKKAVEEAEEKEVEQVVEKPLEEVKEVPKEEPKAEEKEEELKPEVKEIPTVEESPAEEPKVEPKSEEEQTEEIIIKETPKEEKPKKEHLSKKEVERVVKQMKGEVVIKTEVVEFDIGSEVDIVEGPFSGFVGLIEKVDTENEKLTVMVTIFGRMTPVELSFNQVKH